MIHNAAGSNDMVSEAKAYKKKYGISSFPTGSAMVMKPYKLSNRFKLNIFTVGPQGASDPKKNKELYSAIYNSMLKADEYGIKSLATVAISTGIFGFLMDVAKELFFKAALQFFADHPNTSIGEMRFTNFDDQTVSGVYDGFKNAFQKGD